MNTVGPSVAAQLFGSGLIGFREGLEAGVVVMVLIAFLVKSDRRDAVKWLWAGVGIAVAMAMAIVVVVHFGTSTVTALTAELIAGMASLAAVAVVTVMVLWVSKASARMADDLKKDMSTALSNGRLAVIGLAFLAVGREGFETALLMVGYVESVSGGRWSLLGLVLGIVLAVALTMVLYKGAVRLNFHRFFAYTGVFLIFVAAGILTHGVRALQTVGWLPGGFEPAFDISGWYDQSSLYGTVLAGIFSFRPDPTTLQIVAWILYVGIVLPLFLRAGRARPQTAPAEPTIAHSVECCSSAP